MLTVGSLFAGIGGFDLGLERAGMRTVWFCEQDHYCRRVLARHWPGVPCYPDVRALVANTNGRGLEAGRERDSLRVVGSEGSQHAVAHGGGLRAAGTLSVPVPYVDVLAGGFPCQGLSYAGAGAGLADPRSGLWAEYARLVGELRPRYVLMENVAALLTRGLGTVLSDLATLGYDAEWDCIPASAVGAPHRRDRIWLIAYPAIKPADVYARHSPSAQQQGRCESRHGCALADTARHPPAGPTTAGPERERTGQGGEPGPAVADTDDQRRQRRARPGDIDAGRIEPTHGGQWLIEPDVGRVAHGIPARVDRLRALGNSLVPQIAEWLGHRINAYEDAR